MRFLLLLLGILIVQTQISKGVSIADSIKQELVNSNWTIESDYYISNIKLKPNGLSREYGNTLYYKYDYEAYFINKKNGNVVKRMWTSLEGQKDIAGYPYAIPVGNWDLSPTDTNTILIGEYHPYEGEENYILSYKNGVHDTLYRWSLKKGGAFDTYHRHKLGKYYFNAINDREFLAQFDMSYTAQPEVYDLKESFYINTISNYHKEQSRMNLETIKFNQSKNMIMTKLNVRETMYDQPYHSYYQNHYDYFKLTKDSCILSESIDMGNKNKFSEFINDSLCINRRNDTLMLYNLLSKKILNKYPVDMESEFRGLYYDNENDVANLIFKTKDSKILLSVHIPTNQLVLNKELNLPYLGRHLMLLDDGNLLSIGDNDFLYKHSNSFFKYDSIVCNFDYQNRNNSEVQFENTSFGAITNWDWNFGDGNFSNESNPLHRYKQDGDYKVRLTVIDAFGNMSTLEKDIKVEDKLNSSFDFDLFTGQAPLTVNFMNYSSSNSKQFIWNFGDGSFSHNKSPTHIYKYKGNYTVSLTVVDSNGNFHTYLSPKKIIIVE